MRSRIGRVVVLGVALVGGISCGGDGGKVSTPTGTVPPPPTPVAPTPVLTTVTVSLSAGTLTLGQTASATASGADQNGAPISLGTVTWISSATAVATVSASGAVTAVGAGQAQIIAAAGGKQGQQTVTVQLPAGTQTVAMQVDTTQLRGVTNVLTFQGNVPVSATGNARPIVSQTSPQFVMAADSGGHLRGLALANDGTGATVTLNATTTAMSLILLTPGILTADSALSTATIQQVRALPCIAPLAQALKAALATQALTVAATTPDLLSLRRSCAASATQALRRAATQAATASGPLVVAEATANGISAQAVAEDLASHFDLVNTNWARVDVYAREVNAAGAGSPQLVAESMKGAVALSFGSIFTGTQQKPYVLHFPGPYTSAASSMEYWFVGGGFRSPSEVVPSAIQVSWAPFWWGLLDYGVAGMLKGVGITFEGGKYEAVAKLVIGSVSTGTSVGKLGAAYEAGDPSAITREAINAGLAAEGLMMTAYCLTIVPPAPLACVAAAVQGALGEMMALVDMGGWALTLATMPRAFRLRVDNLIGPKDIVVVSGGAQSGVIGASLSPITLRVRNALGKPVKGASVTLRVTVGGGSLTATTVTTDDNGDVTARWQLGSTVGTQSITAAITGSDTPALRVDATATAVAPTANAAQTTLAVTPASVAIGATSTVTVTVKSSSGQVLTTATPSMFAATASTGTLGAFSCVSGVCTATYTAPASAGSPTISATIGGAQVSGSPATITVSAPTASAATSTMTVSSTSIAVNGTATATVTVKNSSGQLLTTATPSTFAASASAGTLGAFSCASGVCTATYTAPSSAGSITISATIGGTNMSGSPATVTVVAPTKLAFAVQPSAATVGATLTPAVQVAVQTASGVTATTATNTVTVSLLNAPGVTLNGTLTRAAVNGIATFDNLTVSAAGTYTLTAASSGLTGSASAAFQITAPAPAVLGVGFGSEQFARIPAGTFLRGSTAGDPDETPVRLITISHDMMMQRTEVTRTQWFAVMGGSGGGSNPMSGVTWANVQVFLTRLNQQDPGKNYRLPTEAEWEYAARAQTTGDYGGTGILADMGWYDGNAGMALHPVAGKTANAWGLYDMHGNVFEWVQDWYSSTYYSTGAVVDPVGPATGTEHVLRGGSAYRPSTWARSSYRAIVSSSFQDNNHGFRLVRNP